MKKLYRLLALSIMLWTVLLPSEASAMLPQVLYEADLRFVDAREATGYYVDMNSAVVSRDTISAKVAIILADENKILLYTMYFNPAKKNYSFDSVQMFSYDEKKPLGFTRLNAGPFNISPGSPIEGIIDYIHRPDKSDLM
ncbi:MAG: hypothetical protein Q4D07_07640 [Selenomonadaceae bacterium]|nr:hypothetical protein [Selenomonadaceae bacterium]